MEPIFKHIFWNLTKDEIDLLNVLINIIERNDDFDEKKEFDYTTSYVIDTNMHELSSSLGFVELKVDTIIQRLDLLTRNLATIYYEENENIYMSKACFVQQFNITSTNKDINKRLNMVVNINLVKILREQKDLFTLFYKFDKYGLKSKYAKLIYERYYNKPKTETLDITQFIDMIDFGLTESKLDWSRLNGNILKRVIKEINDKTDLYFEYEKVKTTIAETNRVQTTDIKVITSVAPEIEIDEYFTDKIIMGRKIDYYIERDIKKKFEQSSQFKTKDTIKNPEGYMHKLRATAQNNRDEYEAKVLLQEWLNNIKYNNKDHTGLVMLYDYSKDNHFITVNNNYKLYDIEKKVEVSSSARDTRIKINAFMNQKGEYNIEYTDEFYKECSISYTRG